MIGQNFGRALMSVGEDVSQYGIAALRTDTAREMNELKLQYQMMFNQMRAAATSAGKAAGTASGFVPNSGLSEEQIAAMSGLTVPEFRAGRDFNRAGPASEVKATADSAGMEYLDPTDRAQLEAAGGMKGETAASMVGRQVADKARSGIVASSIAPQYLDQFEKGRTAADVRGRALDPNATPQQIGDLTARVKAMDGKDQFAIQGDTRIDTSRGNMTTTEVGKAKAAEHNAKAANERDAGSPSNRVHSVVPGGDGKMYVVMKDGTRQPLMGDSGEPIDTKEYNATRARIEAELMKIGRYRRDNEARMAEVERQMAAIYPGRAPGAGKPPSPAPAPGKGNGSGSAPKLDSFFK